MDWTRRQLMFAAGALSLRWPLLHAQAAPLPAAPTTLPDKASFADLKGTYLNAAATHPQLAGAIALARNASSGDAAAFRPNSRHIIANFGQLVGADTAQIILVPSTQAGESLFAAALGLPQPGAHVVSDYLHFCGSQEMYTDMARRGLAVTWVKMTPDGRIPLDDLDRAIIKGKTRLVAISSTAFVNGFQHDLRRVSEIAHAKDALVYADIIQEAGTAPMNLAATGVDAACCATYKWLMAPGTAFLYVSRDAIPKLQPPVYHWSRYTTMLPVTHMYPFDAPGDNIVDGYTPKSGPAGLFAMGYEPNQAALAGLEFSLPYIQNLGLEKIQSHAQTLVARLKLELPRRGYTLLTPAEARSPIVTVVAENANRLAPAFHAANITLTTRWNHIRIAVSVYNDMYDVDRLLANLPRPA